MYRWMLAIAVVLTVGFGLISRTGIALANTDNRGVFICLSGPPQAQCMDLKDDTFTAGQSIIFYSSSAGHGLGWNLDKLGTVTDSAPFTHPFLDTRYHGDSYYYLEKTTATGHNGCIAGGGGLSGSNLTWQPCGANYTKWVYSAFGYLVNIRDSDQSLQPIVAGIGNPACDSGNNELVDSLPLNPPDPFGCPEPWFIY
jgi:hypothetical protein